MRGGELAEAMAVAVHCLVNTQESSSGLERALEMIVGMIDRFNGKEVTNYMESYKAEMLMQDPDGPFLIQHVPAISLVSLT